MNKSRLAIALASLGMASQFAFAANNSIYIDQNATVGTTTVNQSGATGNNTIGSNNNARFAITGGWDSIMINQTSTGATGNSITGEVNTTSLSNTSALDLTQNGNANTITMDVGSTSALANPSSRSRRPAIRTPPATR